MKTGRHFRHNGAYVNKDFKGRKGNQVVRRQANKELVKKSTGKKQARRMEFGVGVGEWFAIFK